MPELLQDGNIKSKNISVFAVWPTSVWYFPLISQTLFFFNSLPHINYVSPCKLQYCISLLAKVERGYAYPFPQMAEGNCLAFFFNLVLASKPTSKSKRTQNISSVLQISQTATSNICSRKEKPKSFFSLESQYFWKIEMLRNAFHKFISFPHCFLVWFGYLVYFIWIAMKANLDPTSVLSFSSFFCEFKEMNGNEMLNFKTWTC